VGWGFQLQQPAFVAGLAYLLFAMALSLSGVVEFGTRLMGVGQTLAASGGYRGSFFTGVLAVAVASPCTAPFMGTALGFSLGQPAAIALAVFAALGLGLALPFLLLGYFPRLGAFLPRPGAWMLTFKNLMAFPLYLSVAWLLWVLGGLAGRDGMGLVLLGLILVAFALWLWNRPGAAALVFKLLALAGAAALLALPQVRVPIAATAVSGAAVADANSNNWEPYSAERLAELRGQGRSVFVDFTADWCLSCKFNERLVLDTEAVHAAFTAGDVALLRGDWTHSDPAITEVLQRYDHPGVPLYLVSVKGGEPKALPQILTSSLVIQALSPG
jgi:thiol:disulfide interchange protein DsbD